MQDERQKQILMERDGQIIHMNVAIPNQRQKQALKGTALDDPATLARKFAQ